MRDAVLHQPMVNMRKITSIIVAICIFFSCSGFVYCDNIDYMARMIKCAEGGTEDDLRHGVVYESLRNEKIEDQNLPYNKTYFFTNLESGEAILYAINFYQMFPDLGEEERELLAKIIYAEAGSVWLSDEWKMCVGEVVLNRMASPEFPNTMREVLEQPGQYYGKNSSYFNNLQPSEKCYEIADRLLNGERYIYDLAVVFQANFKLGSGVALHFKDKYLGSTYFCYSSYMHYYGR